MSKKNTSRQPQRSLSRSHTLLASALAISGVVALVLWQGHDRPLARLRDAKYLLLFDVNVSKSSANSVSDQLRFIASTEANFDPETWVTVTCTDGVTTVLYDGPVVMDQDTCLEQLNDRLDERKDHGATHTQPFWTSVATQVAESKIPTLVAELGDGFTENDGWADHRKIQEDADLLSHSPVIAVVFVGVAPEAQSALHEDFGCLKDRLQFLDWNDSERFEALTQEGQR